MADLPDFIPDSMVAYGDELPDFIPNSMVVAPQAEESFFSRDNVIGGLKGIGQAATDIFTAPADLLFRGGNYLIDQVTGQETNLEGAYPSDYAESIFNYVSGGEGDESVESGTRLAGNIGSIFAVPSQAANIASKVPLLSKAGQTSKAANLASKAVGYGAEGAGYGALFNAKEDDLGGAITEGAALNIAVPAGLQVAGKAAKTGGKALADAARKLDLSAFGIGKQAIKNAMKRMPDVLDDSGNFQNPLSDALDSFKAAGGGQKSMSGEALLGELKGQHETLIGALRQKLTVAQGQQKDAIIPDFYKTRKYVSELAGTNIDDAKRIAEAEIAKTINNTDGTLLSLQDEKVKLGDAIRQTAWGDDAAGQLRVNILKRVRADLRETIERKYAELTNSSDDAVKKLNQELGKRESLMPLFEDIIASGEARNPLGYLVQNWWTSGGFGAATLLAGASGMGAGAAAIPLAGAYAMTPTGRRLLAKNLSSPTLLSALEKGGEAVLDGAATAGRLSTVATRELDQPEGSSSIAQTYMDGSGPGRSSGSLFDMSSQEGFGPQASFPSLFASPQESSGGYAMTEPPMQTREGGQSQAVQSSRSSQAPEILAVNRRPSNGLFSLSGPKGAAQPPVSQIPFEEMLQKTAFRALEPSQFANDLTGDATVTEDSDVVGSLVQAVIQQESGGKKDAVSPKGAQGLMQLMPATGREVMAELGMDPAEYDPFDPELNVTLGTAYLEKLYNMFADEELALAAYNWGQGNVRKAMKKARDAGKAPTWENIRQYAPQETKKYVPMVLRRRERLIAQAARPEREV